MQPLSADVRGEEPGQLGGAEGGGQRDKAEAQGSAVQEPGAEIQPGAEQVFTQKEEANAALEFIVILGSALKVGYQKHIDAEQPRAHTGEEGHQIPQPRDLPTVRADGAQPASGHFQSQKYHNAAQNRFDNPRQGEAQQPGPGDHPGHHSQQQGKDGPPAEVVPVLPSDPTVDDQIRQQTARCDQGVVQPHGQQRRGDQGIPEPNEPLEGVRRQLDEKNKQDHASGVVHEIPSHAKFCVRSQLYHIVSEKKSFFLISAPLTVENCRVWYSLWIF